MISLIEVREADRESTSERWKEEKLLTITMRHRLCTHTHTQTDFPQSLRVWTVAAFRDKTTLLSLSDFTFFKFHESCHMRFFEDGIKYALLLLACLNLSLQFTEFKLTFCNNWNLAFLKVIAKPSNYRTRVGFKSVVCGQKNRGTNTKCGLICLPPAFLRFARTLPNKSKQKTRYF